MSYFRVYPGRAEQRNAAIGAAYELYVSRLRVLNGLCCSPDRDAAQARAVAHARTQVEEAYARWFMLARPDLAAAPSDAKSRPQS
jgi:hypothetical protein